MVELDKARKLSRKEFLSAGLVGLSGIGFVIMRGCGRYRPEDNSISPELTLPKDIIADEELWERYHTKIWNLPDIKLHIRKAAVEHEPIFKELAGTQEVFSRDLPPILKDLVSKDPQRRLDIVLLNGPVVHSEFLTTEQKNNLPGLYAHLKSAERSEIQQLKDLFKADQEYKRTRYEAELLKLEENYKGGLLDKNSFNSQKEDLEIAIRNTFREPEKVELGRLVDTLGKFGSSIEFFRNESTGKPEPIVRYYLVVAVRPPETGKSVFQLYETEHERFTSYSQSKPLSPRQSFPSGEEYKKNGYDRSYLIEGNTVGWALRHEFAHGANKPHPETDLIALEKIKAAFKVFKEKGDTSLYYFVFETPEGLIFTKNSSKEDDNAKA